MNGINFFNSTYLEQARDLLVKVGSSVTTFSPQSAIAVMVPVCGTVLLAQQTYKLYNNIKANTANIVKQSAKEKELNQALEEYTKAFKAFDEAMVTFKNVQPQVEQPKSAEQLRAESMQIIVHPKFAQKTITLPSTQKVEQPTEKKEPVATQDKTPSAPSSLPISAEKEDLEKAVEVLSRGGLLNSAASSVKFGKAFLKSTARAVASLALSGFYLLTSFSAKARTNLRESFVTYLKNVRAAAIGFAGTFVPPVGRKLFNSTYPSKTVIQA